MCDSTWGDPVQLAGRYNCGMMTCVSNYSGGVLNVSWGDPMLFTGRYNSDLMTCVSNYRRGILNVSLYPTWLYAVGRTL